MEDERGRHNLSGPTSNAFTASRPASPPVSWHASPPAVAAAPPFAPSTSVVDVPRVFRVDAMRHKTGRVVPGALWRGGAREGGARSVAPAPPPAASKRRSRPPRKLRAVDVRGDATAAVGVDIEHPIASLVTSIVRECDERPRPRPRAPTQGIGPGKYRPTRHQRAYRDPCSLSQLASYDVARNIYQALPQLLKQRRRRKSKTACQSSTPKMSKLEGCRGLFG